MSRQENEFAIPGVNVVSSSSVNACMEAAKKAGGPVMVTFSKGGGQFLAGKAADNTDDAACIAGTVAGALHVRQVAKLYGVPVILHTDHCQKAWLPWFLGLFQLHHCQEYETLHTDIRVSLVLAFSTAQFNQLSFQPNLVVMVIHGQGENGQQKPFKPHTFFPPKPMA